MARGTYHGIGGPRANASGNLKSDAELYGLVANGSEGSWDVNVDESLSGEHRWSLQLDGPAMYLNCEIEHPRVVEEAICFLSAHAGSNGELPLQSLCEERELEVTRIGENCVTLVWDTGTSDRCAVVVSGPAEFCTRVMLEKSDIQHLIGTLRQVCDELIDSGLVLPTVAKPSK